MCLVDKGYQGIAKIHALNTLRKKALKKVILMLKINSPINKLRLLVRTTAPQDF